MGYFTNEEYAHFECSVAGAVCDIKMIDMDIKGKEDELDKIVGSLIELSEEKEELKKRRDKLRKKGGDEAENNDEVSRIQRELLDKESQYRTGYAKGKREEEKLTYYKRYKEIKYQITRLKDTYSREEAVRIQILNNGIEDGMIITSTAKMAEDIYKLEKYGIAMSPLYFDELAKIIKNHYFIIGITERDYIDNEISKIAIRAFTEFCLGKMGSDLESYLAKDKVHYDVKTTDLSAWYRESPFRRYALREIKEAMIIYGYVDRPTKNRTDCTIDGQKVIRFHKSIIDEIGNAEDKNE